MAESMLKFDTPEQDFRDIDEMKQSFIGRDLVVNDGCMTYCGPITGVRMTSSRQLVLIIDWRAIKHTTGNTTAWHLIDDKAYGYGFELKRSTIRFSADGTVDIIERMGQIAKILTADSASLEKPAR